MTKTGHDQRRQSRVREPVSGAVFTPGSLGSAYIHIDVRGVIEVGLG